MLYKKRKNKLASRKLVNQPYIGVIETTMMYHSMDDPQDRLISVSQIPYLGCINWPIQTNRWISSSLERSAGKGLLLL
jgi:hypothetical protein